MKRKNKEITKKDNLCIISKVRTAGITLIALVITVIILLILAAITINLTVGQKGIITRAQEAGKNYQEAAKKEDEELAKLWNEAENILTGSTGGSSGGNTGGSGQDPVIPGGEDEKPWAQDPNNPDWSKPSTNTEKDNYTDETGKKATIPEGFQVSKKEGEDKIEDGLVIRDAETKNEFVWVPCTEDGKDGSIKYDRYAFLATQPAAGIDTATNSMKIKVNATSQYDMTEAMPSIELNSIKKYGGFYIGRYEVGIVDYDTNVVTSNSGQLANWTGYSNGIAVVQKGKQVWNYITRDKAKEVAEGMYKNNNVVTSRLCSSYTWDTALKFIETKYSDYATNSIQGNYKNTTFTYIDLNGNEQTKAKDSSVLVPTGQTTAVKNIYDLGGNVGEWTTEFCDYVGPSNPNVSRSGVYTSDVEEASCGFRQYGPTRAASIARGFRITLFI